MHLPDRTWFITFEDDTTEKLTTIICGPPDADHRAFGVAIADLIKHVAASKKAPQKDVLEAVLQELNAPTGQPVTLYEKDAQAPAGRKH